MMEYGTGAWFTLRGLVSFNHMQNTSSKISILSVVCFFPPNAFHNLRCLDAESPRAQVPWEKTRKYYGGDGRIYTSLSVNSNLSPPPGSDRLSGWHGVTGICYFQSGSVPANRLHNDMRLARLSSSASGPRRVSQRENVTCQALFLSLFFSDDSLFLPALRHFFSAHFRCEMHDGGARHCDPGTLLCILMSY